VGINRPVALNPMKEKNPKLVEMTPAPAEVVKNTNIVMEDNLL
jgi:hypothetical protein